MNSDPTLSQIMLWAANFIPEGWHKCDGSLIRTQSNPALFSLLGNLYGGDGVTNFALPKLEAPSGLTYIIATQGVYPQRP